VEVSALNSAGSTYFFDSMDTHILALLRNYAKDLLTKYARKSLRVSGRPRDTGVKRRVVARKLSYEHVEEDQLNHIAHLQACSHCARNGDQRGGQTLVTDIYRVVKRSRDRGPPKQWWAVQRHTPAT
jgi:hypothetical protein